MRRSRPPLTSRAPDLSRSTCDTMRPRTVPTQNWHDQRGGARGLRAAARAGAASSVYAAATLPPLILSSSSSSSPAPLRPFRTRRCAYYTLCLCLARNRSTRQFRKHSIPVLQIRARALASVGRCRAIVIDVLSSAHTCTQLVLHTRLKTR